jgi:hypothetical protein
VNDFEKYISVIISIIVLIFIAVDCNKREEKQEISNNKEEVSVRDPQYAGSFYPSSAGEIEKMLEKFYEKIDVKKDSGVVALNVPHAGYIYSGETAATGYYSVGYTPDTVILVGPSHRAPVSGGAVYPDGIWKTPLGDVEVDEEVADFMLEHSEYLHSDKKIHTPEHSLEVQLPFMVYLWGDIKIVPVVVGVGGETMARDLGRAIYDTIENFQDKKILLVVTADLSHYHDLDTASALDGKALEALESDDPFEIIKVDSSGDCEVDAPVALAMAGYVASLMGADLRENLKWTTSAEATGDTSQVVGYSAFKWAKGE